MRWLALIGLLCSGAVAWAGDLQYRIYNSDGEETGSSQVSRSEGNGKTVVQAKVSMQGSWMLVKFSMQGVESVTFDAQGISSFELTDYFESSVRSGGRTTRGRRNGQFLDLTITEEGKEPAVRQIALHDYDFISRVSMRDGVLFWKWLQQAPVQLRSLNLMTGEIEPLAIQPIGEQKLVYQGKQIVVHKFTLRQGDNESEVWVLPGGDIYRNSGRFGYSVLQTGVTTGFGW